MQRAGHKLRPERAGQSDSGGYEQSLRHHQDQDGRRRSGRGHDARAERDRPGGAHDPGHFLRLTSERAWRFWLEPSRRLKSTLATTFVTLLGFAGLWMLPRGAGVKLVWLILLSYPLVYYLVQVDRRYRYPVEWIFIPPAIHAVAMIYRNARPHHH